MMDEKGEGPVFAEPSPLRLTLPVFLSFRLPDYFLKICPQCQVEIPSRC